MGGKEYGNPLNPPVHIDQNLKIYIIGSKIKIVADLSSDLFGDFHFLALLGRKNGDIIVAVH